MVALKRNSERRRVVNSANNFQKRVCKGSRRVVNFDLAGLRVRGWFHPGAGLSEGSGRKPAQKENSKTPISVTLNERYSRSETKLEWKCTTPYDLARWEVGRRILFISSSEGIREYDSVQWKAVAKIWKFSASMECYSDQTETYRLSLTRLRRRLDCSYIAKVCPLVKFRTGSKKCWPPNGRMLRQISLTA